MSGYGVDERENSGRLRKSEILAFSLVYSLIVIGICLAIDKNFFNNNPDAVNESLPFFTQMGRIWSSGKFPFLTDNTLLGGNALVEMSHCAFTPQSILASLLAWHCEYKQVAAIFLAFFNMTLMVASCLVIGNLYRLRPAYSLLFSAFCIIQPEFLFLDSRGCYNSAIAASWFLASMATFLRLAHRVSLKNFLLNFLAVFFLLTTCYIFAGVAYALFALIFFIFHVKKPVLLPPLVFLVLASFLALLCVLPLYSEYVYNGDLHSRFFMFDNSKNGGVFPWSSEFLTFLPTYFDFIMWNGYQFFVIPFAFSTVFVPLIFFNRNFFSFYRVNSEVKFFIALILAYFICSQLPCFIGPMRLPVRFLPFFAFTLCLTTSFILEYAERKNSSVFRYVFFIAICFLLSCSKSAGQEKIFLYLHLLSILLLLLVYIVDKRDPKSPIIYLLFGLCVLLILFGDKNTKVMDDVAQPIPLPRKIEFPMDFNNGGYILTVGKLDRNIFPYYTSLYLGRSGLYNNIKSINGYTPLGYKNWTKNMGGYMVVSQVTNFKKILDTLLVPVEGTDMCRANAWRISTFVLSAEVAQKNLERLEKCGYHLGADTSGAPMVYATLPFEETKGWEKLPPVSLPPLEGIVHESHEDAFDRLSLPARSEPVKLVFPRLYWHGFRAAFNGERLDVTPDESGLLTSVTVPAGPAGAVEFWFFPETWRYMWVCPALGLMGLLCCGIFIRRRRPAGFWTPDIPR